MSEKFRVYNHTDRELIVAIDDAGEQQYALQPQSVSPRNATPKLLWSSAPSDIDKYMVWQFVAGHDVHVYEAGADSSIGAASPIFTNPLGKTADLHIAGLGISPKEDFSPPVRDRLGAWFSREDETWVTVLGAGITGLTVAHELVTRGFRVQVIEKAHSSPADRQLDDPNEPRSKFYRGLRAPDVGGVARTQWATQPLERAAIGVMTTRALGDVADDEQPNTAGNARVDALGSGVEPDRPISLRSVHGDAIWFGKSRQGGVMMGDYRAFCVTWTKSAASSTPDDFAAGLLKWLRALSQTDQRSVAAIQLIVVVYQGGHASVKAGYGRFDAFVDKLFQVGTTTHSATLTELHQVLGRLQLLPTARIDVPEPEPMPPANGVDGNVTFVGLMVRVHEHLGLIAGEHGFRFFPGFYRHLRDTMRRTPIFDPLSRTFTPRTALDNLQQVEWQVIVDPTRRHPTAFSRTPFSTIGGLIHQYRTIRSDLGYRPVDLLRFSLRVLRYATSSAKRRARYYEHMSWWTFLSKPHLDDPRDEQPVAYGARFAEALRHSPKALVAMTAEHADARTQGNISVQLLMDQFGLHDQSDSTLVGPTSTSWLTHWRTYLEEQGVQFFLGEVTRIFVDQDRADRAGLDIAFPFDRTPFTYLDGEKARKNRQIADHYIVSALDIGALARVGKVLRPPRGPENWKPGALSDLDRLVCNSADRDRDLEDIQQIGQQAFSGTRDRFQTLTGIQLYYRRHVSFANGHLYAAASPWGLSAISQVQFWGPFGSGHRGRLSGNLSVDIGSWRGDGNAPSPNDLDRDTIAAMVQDQLTYSPNRERVSLRRAQFYHLDDFIGFGPSDHNDALLVPRRNYAPFLINVTSDWDRRPRGEPWAPNDPDSRERRPGHGQKDGVTWLPERGGYPVHHDNLVIAGTHMRTFTRMATMEAANESARHAVNSILDHATWCWEHGGALPDARFAVRFDPRADINVTKNTTPFGDYCDIWNPEHCEFQDLEFMRMIDDHLMDAGAKTAEDDAPPGAKPRVAPHIFDILKIDELPDLIQSDGEVLHALDLIGSALKAFEEAQVVDAASVVSVIDRARKQLATLFGRGK